MIKSLLITAGIATILMACQPSNEQSTTVEEPKEKYELLGFESQLEWGEHLVAIGHCHDCHSPKVMTDMGPVPDPERLLSGHPADAPVPNLDRKVIEENGYSACDPGLTSWIGPWGISFAANLTPDNSGIGSWTEENFFRVFREGKYKGLENSRMLLPPMPWQPELSGHMTDDELRAVFAYLKSMPPVKNIVPQPVPPTSAGG